MRKHLNTTYRKLRRFGPYGPRGWAMLVLALAAAGRCVDYLRPVKADSATFVLRELAQYVPVSIWGILWGITALVVLVSAFRKKQAIALAILAGMSMLWAVLYVATAAFGLAGDDVGRAWGSAIGFLAFFVLVVAMALMINPVRIKDVPDA